MITNGEFAVLINMPEVLEVHSNLRGFLFCGGKINSNSKLGLLYVKSYLHQIL